MVLIKSDLERITKLGFNKEDFAYYDNGTWRLRNVDGRCFFLDSEGKCIIYKNRPLGCRAYPVIEYEGRCIPDYEVCPYAHLLSKEELSEGCKLLYHIFKELKYIQD